jgi:hypothetical protein
MKNLYAATALSLMLCMSLSAMAAPAAKTAKTPAPAAKAAVVAPKTEAATEKSAKKVAHHKTFHKIAMTTKKPAATASKMEAQKPVATSKK